MAYSYSFYVVMKRYYYFFEEFGMVDFNKSAFFVDPAFTIIREKPLTYEEKDEIEDMIMKRMSEIWRNVDEYEIIMVEEEVK